MNFCFVGNFFYLYNRNRIIQRKLYVNMILDILVQQFRSGKSLLSQTWHYWQVVNWREYRTLMKYDFIIVVIWICQLFHEWSIAQKCFCSNIHHKYMYSSRNRIKDFFKFLFRWKSLMGIVVKKKIQQSTRYIILHLFQIRQNDSSKK